MSRYAFFALCFILATAFIAFSANTFSQQETKPAVNEPIVTEKGFHYESINVMLPRLSDKGLRGADIPYKLKNFRYPRPKPVAEFALPEGTAKTSRAFEPIKIELLEEAGTARQASVRFGVPFPEKSLYSTDVLEVRDPAGKKVPAQFSVLEFWQDKSLRWCLVQFSAPLKASEQAIYTIRYTEKVVKPETSIIVKEDDAKIVVDTGKINVEIDKVHFNIFRHILCGNESVGAFADGGVTGSAEDGREFSLSAQKPRRIAFEEKGSETVVIRINGSYAYADGKSSFLDYTARLRFVRNSARVQVDLTTTNVGLENEFSDFKNLRLTFKPATTISNISANVYDAALAAYKNKAGAPSKTLRHTVPTALTQWTDKNYNTSNMDTQSGRLASGLLCETDKGNLAFAVKDLWKRYPKGFSADQKSVSIEILPPLPSLDFGLDLPHYLAFPFREGFYRLKWGMSFTESLFFDFAPDATAAGVQAEADLPVVAVVDRDWYAKSGVVPGVTMKSDNTFNAWDVKRIKGFDAHMKLKEEQREYGFLNYGDWYGERVTNWGNNEYDTAKSLFATFARTGNRDMHRLAVATAMHQADVDIVHAYPDPYFVGGQCVHSIGHTGYYGQRPSARDPIGRIGTWSWIAGWHVQASNGHTWVGGMLDSWRYTGAARPRDAALELGEHITWGLTRVYRNLGTHERTAGWSLTAICQLAVSTNDPEYLTAAKKIIAVPLKEQNFEKGGAWPHVLPADHAGEHKDTFGNAVFLVGTVVEGMRRYHRITEASEVKKSLEAACQWLKITRNPKTGEWPYTASWEGKPYRDSNNWAVYLSAAMLYTARICDRQDIADSAIAGLRTAIRDNVSGSGKGFAQSGLFVADMMEELTQWCLKTKQPIEKF